MFNFDLYCCAAYGGAPNALEKYHTPEVYNEKIIKFCFFFVRGNVQKKNSIFTDIIQIDVAPLPSTLFLTN